MGNSWKPMAGCIRRRLWLSWDWVCGRMGIYELLVANDEIRELANQGGFIEIKKAAVQWDVHLKG